jgi:N-acetylglutamate synthase-like GNAT family acetyltransferase
MQIIEFLEKYQENTVTFITSILDELHPGQRLIEIPRYKDLKNIKNSYSSRSRFWLILDKDNVIGTAGAIEKDEKNATIQRLFIQKEFRRKGYGEKLMLKAIQFCKNNNFEYINVITSRQSKANFLFKKLEFKQNGSNGDLIYYQLHI